MKQAHILNCFINYIALFTAVVIASSSVIECVFMWGGSLCLSETAILVGQGVQHLGLSKVNDMNIPLMLSLITNYCDV